MDLHFIIAPPSSNNNNNNNNNDNNNNNNINNSFFPYSISHWNKLDGSVKHSPSISSFKKNLIKFIRPPPRTFYGISDRFGIKLLTKIRVGFSDLRAHIFNHKF